jgi:FkbM family methyltransferase
MNLKNFLRKGLRSVGYDAVDVRRFDRAMGAEVSWPTHERLVSYLIEHALSRTSQASATFLQIGANDGIKDNFTGSVLRREDVRIVLLEPDPFCAARLERDYSGRANVSVLQKALGAEDGFAKLFHFDSEEEQGIQLNVFNSFDRALLEEKKNVFSLQASIVSRQVECVTLASLSQEVGVSSWDVLVSDIEGFDHEVVRQVSAMSRDNIPRLFVFEHAWLEPSVRSKCYRDLADAGYAIIAGENDTIALISES